MMNWIAGNWSDGFKCIVNHDGVFDTRGMAYSTEEIWFTEWENGGPYYEVPQLHEKFNPALKVKNWKTPMLVVQGDLDFRIPTAQGWAPSRRCSAAAYRASSCSSRTRTTGC
jgi:dipeptidyl aminopeptidase/acylaminoacyl peptidase